MKNKKDNTKIKAAIYFATALIGFFAAFIEFGSISGSPRDEALFMCLIGVFGVMMFVFSAIMLLAIYDKKNPDKDQNKEATLYAKRYLLSYFEMHDVQWSVMQIHHIRAVYDKKKGIINITIILGRPGIFIGKAGKQIDDIKKYLSGCFDLTAEIHLKEYDALWDHKKDLIDILNEN